MGLYLEVFETEPQENAPEDKANELERIRAEAYSDGYAAGQNDLEMLQISTLREIAASLSEKIHEIRRGQDSLKQQIIEPLGHMIVHMLHPISQKISESALPTKIASVVQQLIAKHPNQRLRIVGAPILKDIIAQITDPDIRDILDVEIKENLVTGQIYFHLEQKELCLDLEAATAQINAHIEDFFTPTQKD